MDLRSPFAASLASLPHQEGARIPWSRRIPAPADMGLEMIGVPEGGDLDIDLELNSVSEGVYVSGSVRAPIAGNCARCLREIAGSVDEPIGELVLYPQRQAALVEEGDEEAGQMPVVDSDHIDLEPIVRDAVVLSLPFVPLCKGDCQGICPGCGQLWEDLPEATRTRPPPTAATLWPLWKPASGPKRRASELPRAGRAMGDRHLPAHAAPGSDAPQLRLRA